MEQGHGWAWSCAPDEPRSRRSTDGALLVGATVLLSLVLAARPGSGPTGRAIESFLRSLSFLRHLWLGFIVIGAASAALVLLWTVASRRFRLLRDIAVAAFAAWLLMLIVHHVFKTPPSARAAGLFEPEAEAWPVVRLTLAATVLCVAAPYLVRPLKYWQRVVLLAMSLGSIARGGTNVNGVLVALCVAWVAAAAVHLVFGSPGGRPALSRMSADLAALGFASTDVRAAPSGSDGVPMFTAISSGTPLAIKVFGRDAWHGQLFATTWRFLTYRGPGASLSLTRLQQAEHEALMTMIAVRARIASQAPIVVARVASDDVVLAHEARAGQTLMSRADFMPSTADVAALWALVDGLHGAGLVHRAISPEVISRDPSGVLSFAEMSNAVLTTDDRSRTIDDAQLFASTLVLTDGDTAMDALFRRSADEVAAMLRYLQPAVMPRSLRDALAMVDIDLDDVRKAIAHRAEIELPTLETIRRASASTMVVGAAIAVGCWFFISTLTNLDWAEVRHALGQANYWWLIFAFLVAQAPRIGGSLSMLGACKAPLPYGPVLLLQYALPFIDVAAPAAAGRIAATMRFQQRYGVPAAAAFSASIIDSGAGFAAQLILLAITFRFTELDLAALGADRFDVDFRFLLLIVIIIAFVVSLLVAIPAIRRKLAGPARDIWRAMSVLRSPSKFALLLGGSAVTELLYPVALLLCVRSLGLSVPYASVLVVTLFVRFVSGVSPIPGGLGIAEAGLTAGLVAIGVPVEYAFPAALIYRLCTFYVPPAYGWAVLGVLRNGEYL